MQYEQIEFEQIEEIEFVQMEKTLAIYHDRDWQINIYTCTDPSEASEYENLYPFLKQTKLASGLQDSTSDFKLSNRIQRIYSIDLADDKIDQGCYRVTHKTFSFPGYSETYQWPMKFNKTRFQSPNSRYKLDCVPEKWKNQLLHLGTPLTLKQFCILDS